MSELPIRCDLPEGFLKEEIREGYTVSEKLKKIWAVELDLMQEFLRVCDKHGLKPQVFAGTLLGAIRHKGFIPWDDDMDVALSRSDFERLLKIGPLEFRHPYFLQHAGNDRRHFFGFARLRNSETTAAIRGFEGADYNNGIYIDIFVLDGYPRNKFKAMVLRNLKWGVEKFLIANYYKGGSGLRRILYNILKPFSRLLTHERLISVYRWLQTRDMDSPQKGLLTQGGYFLKYWLTSDELLNTTEARFEWIDVPIPVDYDKVLTRLYGDYMQPPPTIERGKWHEGLIKFDPNCSYKNYFAKERD